MSSAGPRRVARPLVVLTWALAAALAGTVVWWAVAVIGGAHGAARDGVLTQSQVAALAALSTPSSVGSTPSGPTSPAPAQSSTPTDAATAAPPTAAPPTVPPKTVPPATQEPTAAEVARTWDVPGGQVGASCRGAQIGLLYATPQDGWTVEVKHAGPAEVEVEFRRAEAETKVRAVCVSGVPEMGTAAGDE